VDTTLTVEAEGSVAEVVGSMDEFNLMGDEAAMQAFAASDKDASNSLDWRYYRKADGGITLAPGWPVQMANYVMKGMVCLPQYGGYPNGFTRNVPIEMPNGQVAYLRNWRSNLNPYLPLLYKGGAKEFTAKQLLQMGWHRNPPLKGLKFPQLKKVAFTDIECPTCHKQFVDCPSLQIDGKHNLQRHESVAHRETASQSNQARLTAGAMEQLSEPMRQIFVAMLERQNRTDELLARLIERVAPETPVVEVTPGTRKLPASASKGA
jgi:hypothetical protein